MSRRRRPADDGDLQLGLLLGEPVLAPLGEVETLRFDLSRHDYVDVQVRRVAEGWVIGHHYSLPTRGSHCGAHQAYWRRVYCSRECALARACDHVIEAMERTDGCYSAVEQRLAKKALGWLRTLRAPLPDPCPDPPTRPYRPRGVTREQWAEEREQSQRRWAAAAAWAARDATPCAECGVRRDGHYPRYNPDQPRDPAACPGFKEAASA